MANGYIQLPPDGTGKKTQTFTYQSGSDTIHQQVIVISDNNNPERTQKIDQYGSQYVRFNEGPQQLDGLGNSKMSQAESVQTYDFYYDKLNRLVYETTTNAGTAVTHSASGIGHGIKMSVTDAQGDYVMRRSHRWHKVPLSTGGLVEMTVFHGDNGKEGNVRTWGYYDDDHGFKFRLSGSDFFVGVQDNGTETWYSQSQWNVDTLDGTGKSLLSVTPTTIRRFWINFKPLGGQVKFGIYDNITGNRVNFHEVYDYFSKRDLPITWENWNQGSTSGTSEMTHGVTMVLQEGKDVAHGKINTYYPGQSFNCPVGEDTLVLSVKPRETFKGIINRVGTIPKAFSARSTHPCSIRVVKNTTLTGATWGYSTLPSSSIVGDLGATDFSGGITLVNYYLEASESFHHHPENIFGIHKEYLHLHAVTSSYESYSIVVKPFDVGGAPTASINISTTWEELI